VTSAAHRDEQGAFILHSECRIEYATGVKRPRRSSRQTGVSM